MRVERGSRFALTRVSRVLAGIAGLGLLLVIACGRPPAADVVTEVDSLGVRHTTTTAADRTYAVIDDVATLSIGGPDAMGAAQFFQIQGVRSDARGHVWVMDGRSRELRLFDRAGTHLVTMGGEGDGPGEFRRPRLLGPMSGDSVVVADGATGRVAIFTADGALGRLWTIPFEDQPARALRGFSDGSVLAQVPRIVNARALEDGQLLADTSRLVRIYSNGVIEAQATLPGMLWIWTGRSQIPMPFGAPAEAAVGGDVVFVVTGDEARVRAFRDGHATRSFGVDRAPRAIGTEEVSAFRASVEESIPEERRSDHLRALDHPARPQTLPAYRGLLVASDGTVWAQVFHLSPLRATTWDVFGLEGGWLGNVEMPAGFRPLQISPTHLFGVWYDAVGVEHVRSYGWKRVEPAGG